MNSPVSRRRIDIQDTIQYIVFNIIKNLMRPKKKDIILFGCLEKIVILKYNIHIPVSFRKTDPSSGVNI